MAVMQLADKLLVAQVHRAKITADVIASVMSNTLLRQGRPKATLAARIVVPVVGSLAAFTLADLDVLVHTAPGRYVLAHMPPSAQAVRLAGDALMGLGACRRKLDAPASRSGRHRGRLGACGLGQEHPHEGDDRNLTDVHRGRRGRPVRDAATYKYALRLTGVRRVLNYWFRISRQNG